jgi:hypothetical protein
MDYWATRFGFKDGLEFTPGLFYKNDKDHWLIIDQDAKFVNVLISSGSGDAQLTDSICAYTAAKARAEPLHLLTDINENVKKVLSISPSWLELEKLLPIYPNAVFHVTDAHDPYLDELFKRRYPSNPNVIRLPAVDLNQQNEFVSLGTDYDLVVCVMVLNYVEHPIIVLDKLRSITKSCIIAVWLMARNQRWSTKNIISEEELNKSTGAVFEWDSQIGMHCSTRGEQWTWTEAYFLELVKKAGFTVTKTERFNAMHGSAGFYVKCGE